MSDPVYVQVPPSELRRMLDAAAQAGAEAALRSVADRLDRALDLLERSGSHKSVLSTREAAEYAGVRPATVLSWIRGGLPATDRGGSAGYVVRKADLDGWIAGDGSGTPSGSAEG